MIYCMKGRKKKCLRVDERSAMRLDKFLAHAGAGSRSEVKQAVRKGQVLLNGTAVRDSAAQVGERDQVVYRGTPMVLRGHRYYMLHKPAGVVTATRDAREKTVLDLLRDIPVKGLFPAGRLDKDTEGLLLLTDDGELAHSLLSPRRHVEKTYQVTVQNPLSPEDISRLEAGVDIGDKKPTLPARVRVTGEKQIFLTVREGRYHQIKRMLDAVDNQVLYLKRLSMGGLVLDDTLEKGAYRPLTIEETERLKRAGGGVGPNPLKERLKDFKGILFDLDGTLVDSMWMWQQIDIEYLSRFGIPLPGDLQKEIEGMSFSETAAYFKKRFSLRDSLETIKADWNAMAAHKYGHEVFYKDGAEEFLSLCRQRNIRLGVATSNSRELVDIAAGALSFQDRMDCIMTACEVRKGKPAPDIYLAVAGRLGIAPEECLVFEDIPAGIAAGKAAGMKVCAVADEYSEDLREEKAAMADFYIDSYRELL